MKSRWFQQLGGGRLEEFGLRLWSRLQFTALHGRKDKETVDLLWKIHQDRRSLLSAFEAYLVFALARAQTKRPGDFAEVGVYKGASAKLICEAKGEKTLRLFDTYEGLPPQGANDPGVHREQQYACSLESVQNYLQGYSKIEFYKGIFPASAKASPRPNMLLPTSTSTCTKVPWAAWSTSIPAWCLAASCFHTITVFSPAWKRHSKSSSPTSRKESSSNRPRSAW